VSSIRAQIRLRARAREAATLVLLACAALQPVYGASLVLSAFALGGHAGAHPHAVAVHSDGNHVDVVLAHREDAAHEHDGATPDHMDLAGFTESDHVLHVALDDAANANARRVELAAMPALTASALLPLAAPTAPFAARRSAQRAGAADHLRSVVLRL